MAGAEIEVEAEPKCCAYLVLIQWEIVDKHRTNVMTLEQVFVCVSDQL